MAEQKLKENTIYCAKCNKEMKEVLLPRYEYDEGVPLHNVSAYKCTECNKVFFTEAQAKQMELRTNEIREYEFGFERKLNISGRSLVLGIPKELVNHLRLKKGQKVKIFPIAKEGLMIKKNN